MAFWAGILLTAAGKRGREDAEGWWWIWRHMGTPNASSHVNKNGNFRIGHMNTIGIFGIGTVI